MQFGMHNTYLQPPMYTYANDDNDGDDNDI